MAEQKNSSSSTPNIPQADEDDEEELAKAIALSLASVSIPASTPTTTTISTPTVTSNPPIVNTFPEEDVQGMYHPRLLP